MTVELKELHGPLTDEQVRWITGIYGPVDAKYRSAGYVRHQFVGNPFGWSVNVFALDGGRPVGHCGVVPFRARRNSEGFVAGKLEALAVDTAHRGRRQDGGSVATDILSSLYPFAIERGVDILFGLAPPPVARIHVRAGCHLVPTDTLGYTCVVDASSFGRHGASRRRRIGARALSWAQRALLDVASLPLPHSARLETPSPGDERFSAAATYGTGWTVSGADSWVWLAGSGVLRMLDLPGRSGARALVRLDESDATTVQILSWEPRQRTLAAAIRLLKAASALARRHCAPTLRFQPWRHDADEAVLGRACALMGFIPRPEAELLLYPSSDWADSVRFNPFFYTTF